MFGRRSLAAAAAVLVGLLAGYWHFAELLERPAPGGRVTRPAEPSGGSAPIDSAPNDGETATAATETIETTTEPPAAETAGLPSEPDAAAAVPPEQAAAEAQTPTFDVLRVEADGSAVIAGRAEPGATIRVMSGADEIARETANAAGEFAVALDDPLAVGDHQLTLDASSGGVADVSSLQTAIVSVPPRGRESELLVMLEEPNQPARLVEAPTTAADAALDAAAVDAPTEPPVVAATTPADAQPAEREIAALAEPDPSPAVPATAPSPAPVASPLAIGAIEIEGDRIYIAGAAKPSARVRLYVDGDFVADARGGAQSEFLASARADVPVGSHVVRADELGSDGSVTARVEVPFDRTDDRPMSAIAAAPAAPEAEIEIAAAPTATTTPTPAAAGGLAAEAPLVSPETAPAAPAPMPSVALSAPAISGGTAPVQAQRQPAARDDVTGSKPTIAGQPNAAATSSQRSNIEAAPDRTIIAASPPAGEVTATLPAPPPLITPPSEPAPLSAEPPSPLPAVATPVVRQAALQPVEGRVLIRRGDSLWRISRDTYGRGSRYTVIYLANGDQIRDPDLIYPGQIFRMPDDTAAN